MLAIAWRSLTSHRSRTAATGAVILIGAFMLALTFAGTSTMRTAVDEGLEVEYRSTDVVVSVTDATSEPVTSGPRGLTIDDDEVAEIRELPQVRAASGVLTADVIMVFDDALRGASVETLPDDRRFVWQSLAEGSWPASTSEIAVAASTLDSLGLEVGDRIVLGTSSIGPAAFTIVGSVDTAGSLRHDTFSYLIATPEVVEMIAGTAGYTSVRIDAAPGASADDVVEAVNATNPSGWPQTTDELVGGSADLYGAGLSLLRIVVLGLVGVALVVTAMVLTTTFRVSLAVRTREIGLQRCLGASRGQVFAAVTLEALLLGLVAGLLGTALGLGAVVGGAWALGHWVGALSLASLTVPVAAWAVPILVALALPLLAGLVPAVRAAGSRRSTPSRPTWSVRHHGVWVRPASSSPVSPACSGCS